MPSVNASRREAIAVGDDSASESCGDAGIADGFVFCFLRGVAGVNTFQVKPEQLDQAISPTSKL